MLPPGQQLVARDKWPFVGEREPRADDGPWEVRVRGCVQRPLVLSLHDLAAMPQVERTIDIHCVTRWSKLGVRFRGVPLRELLAQAQPTAEARFVSFIARSERAHSTSLPLTEVFALDALVALAYEGGALSREHGGPVRVVVPGRYFYKSVKWLEEIELLAEDRLGYWEASAGYHNTADPWREQRYMARTLTKQQAAAVIAARDFSSQDLRSIDASGRDLAQLNARGALLRDADFRRSKLCGACFDQANLTNAHFESADLRGVTFIAADVEGANFCGADLRGADFTGASLFGAMFIEEQPSSEKPPIAAVWDDTTRFHADQLEALTPRQFSFLEQSVRLR